MKYYQTRFETLRRESKYISNLIGGFDMNKKIILINIILVCFIIVIGSEVKDSLTANASNGNGLSKSEAIPTPTTESKQTEITNVRGMNTAELYEGGKLYIDVSDNKTFQEKVTSLTIPDARKGERATDIHEREDWYKRLIFLNSIPDKNIYLYGFNDEELNGFGLILDIGNTQHIYTYPIPYMSTTALAPSIGLSKDGRKLFVSCHTGNGTGMSLSQLYVFQIKDKAKEFYVDINRLVELLNNKLIMTYDFKNNIMTIYSEGKQIATDHLIMSDVIPDGFYCGKFIAYKFNDNGINVICDPILNTKGQSVDNQLANISLESDIKFQYDKNGKIIGFDIGEITAVKKPN